MEQYRYGYDWQGDRTKAIRLSWQAVAPKYFYFSSREEDIHEDEWQEKFIGVAQGLEDYTDKNPAIDALKVAGIKQLEAMAEATAKQLKAVAASEIKEARAVAREIRSEFATFFTQLDALAKKVFELGQEFGKIEGELQKYEGVKGTLESHAVAAEAEK
ncbi:hypothetical protein ES703_35684 [subsurface metagenome]